MTVRTPAPAGRRYSARSAAPARSVADWPPVTYLDPCACLDPAGAHVPRCTVSRDLAGAGFAWGYQGSGPRALAEALLADVLGFAPPALLATLFTEELIVGFDVAAPWSLEAAVVRRWAGSAARRADLPWSGCLCAEVEVRPGGEDPHFPGCPASDGFGGLL